MDLVHKGVHCHPDTSDGSKLEYIRVLCICNINKEKKNTVIREMLWTGERKEKVYGQNAGYWTMKSIIIWIY